MRQHQNWSSRFASVSKLWQPCEFDSVGGVSWYEANHHGGHTQNFAAAETQVRSQEGHQTEMDRQTAGYLLILWQFRQFAFERENVSINRMCGQRG